MGLDTFQKMTSNCKITILRQSWPEANTTVGSDTITKKELSPLQAAKMFSVPQATCKSRYQGNENSIYITEKLGL
jgi:hypothetical protein